MTFWKKLAAPLAVILPIAASTGLTLLPLPLQAADLVNSDNRPQALVNDFYKGLLDVMKNATTLGFAGRYKRLEPAVTSAFNLPLMTRIAVGQQWTTIPEPQQQKLVEAFTRFTVSTYANRFDGFGGERFEVSPDKRPINNGVMVETKLVQGNGEPIALNYVLRETDGKWQIIDVYLSGTISELANRRAEFQSVLKRDGVDGLITMLNQKTTELEHS